MREHTFHDIDHVIDEVHDFFEALLQGGYLKQAAQAVTALERLDREGLELGLEPMFTDQDLAWIQNDLQGKYDQVAADRNRSR